MNRSKLLAIFTAAALTGCASDTTKIESAYVSPETYANYDCQQIGAEFARLSRKAEDLGAVVDKMAADDQAQAFVGIVLFWPALFFLEGGETQQTQEYARLKGQMEALEKASVAQGCGADIRHVAAAAGTTGSGGGASTTSKLASLKMLYRDGAITEEEYIERRKALVDEQARRELEMMERQKAAAAAQQQQATTAPNQKLKVVILPAGRGIIAAAGTTRQAEENDIFDRVHAFVKRNQALEIAYSTADPGFPDHPIEFNPTRLWIGVSEKKPRESVVYATAEDLNADLALMFYWEPRLGRKTINVYLFDVGNKRMYKRGDEGYGADFVDELLEFVFHDPLGGLALES